MATVLRVRTNPMTEEVQEMIQVRHVAEQKGEYDPLGRLQWIQTEHGLIQFPAVNGEGCGPDLAVTEHANTRNAKIDIYGNPDCLVELTKIEHGPQLIILGPWSGLPPLRINSTKPCPKCRHICDVCAGNGKKLCERCGGRKWIAGPWLPCPGPSCVRDSGGFGKGRINPAGCATCSNTGQVPEEIECPMCEGSGQMRCTRCAGTGKFSTGRANGAIDWDASPKCKACDGTTRVGKWERQSVKQFTNAILRKKLASTRKSATWLALGPIREFAIRDPRSLHTHIFQVGADSAGDLLMLLVPASAAQKPQKAYLVGGVVSERKSASAVPA